MNNYSEQNLELPADPEMKGKIKLNQKCEECDLISKSDKITKCCFCDLNFKCKNCKHQHIVRAHYFDSNWSCPRCEFVTSRKDSLRFHVKTHEKLFSCETCDKKFANNFQMKNHQQNQRHGHFVSEPEIKFDCKSCQSSFLNKNNLKRHEQMLHNKINFSCDVCGQIFKLKANLQQHAQTHLKVPCPICQRMLAKYRLKSHIEEHSSKVKFECDACDKVYLNKKSLNSHKSSKHEIDQVQCDLCSKIFKNKFKLRGHMLIHLKDSCPICKKSMIQNNLKNHMKKFHSEEKTFGCSIVRCRQRFETQKELNEHKKIHIGPKCYKCPTCNHQMKSITSMRIHIYLNAHLKKEVAKDIDSHEQSEKPATFWRGWETTSIKRV